MPEDKIRAKSIKFENGIDNAKELNEYDTNNSTDEFDWDFILDREWLRIKK